jgi:hypothetical protein
MHVNMV